MALPKRRHSKSRRDKSRAHQALSNPPISNCPQCGQLKLAHRVCPNCGYYRKREVVPVVVEKQKKEKRP